MYAHAFTCMNILVNVCVCASADAIATGNLIANFRGTDKYQWGLSPLHVNHTGRSGSNTSSKS